MKKIILFACLFFPMLVIGQGYIRDDKQTAAFKKFESSEYGFTEKPLPSSFSLRKYCPPPLFQDGSTCVGWALAYGSMSTMFNSLLDIQEPVAKMFTSFDPTFTYLLSVVDKDNECASGIVMPFAISQSLRYGFKRRFAPPGPASCENKLNDFFPYYAEAFKPVDADYIDLSEVPTAKDKIKLVKTVLVSLGPLPFAMEMKTSHLGDKGPVINAQNPLWIPKANDKTLGGHAMTVVGFNDTKYGGAFEIMNSYGPDFGDDGFFWIKYNDFINYCLDLYYVGLPKLNALSCVLGDCNGSYSMYVDKSKDIYEGQFSNGMFDGFGTYIWNDGDIYIGYWKNDKRHGQGIFISNGKIVRQMFSRDELLNEEEFGFAIVSNPSIERMIASLKSNGIEVIGQENPDYEKINLSKSLNTISK